MPENYFHFRPCVTIVLCTVFGLILLLAGPIAYGQEGRAGSASRSDSVPEEIRKAFLSMCSAMSPIAVEWTRTRKTALTEDTFRTAMRLAETTRTFFHPQEVEYCFQAGMVRTWKLEWYSTLDADFRFLRTEQDTLVIAFNREKVFLWSGESTPPEKTILSIDFAEQVAEEAPVGKLIPANVFKYFNVHMPATPSELLVGCKPYTDVLSHRKGAVVSVIPAQRDSGRVVISIAESDGTAHRFEIDSQRLSVVNRYVLSNSKGNPVLYAYPGDYRPLAGTPNVSLPRSCRVEWFQFDASSLRDESAGPLFVEEYEIRVKSQREMPKEYFSITDTRPGVLISDSTLPGARALKDGRAQYRIPADLSQLESVIEAAKQGMSTIETQKLSASRLVLLLINGAIFVAVVFYLWFRKRRGGARQ